MPRALAAGAPKRYDLYSRYYNVNSPLIAFLVNLLCYVVVDRQQGTNRSPWACCDRCCCDDDGGCYGGRG